MTEFMGLIRGRYDAKADGFLPGGASLHSCMTPHGPDTATFENAVRPDNEAPSMLASDSLAFMFEFSMVPRLTPAALGAPTIDRNYYQCWLGLRSHFDPGWAPPSPREGKPEGAPREHKSPLGDAAGDSGEAVQAVQATS
jgi:homogentisate 1,2-dioxygenase